MRHPSEKGYLKMTDELVPSEHIKNRIYFIRGEKVMLDRDLAELYGVETKALNRQVKRNIGRFPADFMFQLTEQEKNEVVTNWHHLKPLKYSPVLPYAFTEQGVSQLSGVLNSDKAIEVNIQIIREFVAMRHYLINKNELENAFIEKFDKSFKEMLAEFSKLLETKASGITIDNSNSTNSPITISDVTIGGSTKWADEAYELIQKILADLEGVKLAPKTKEVIKANSELLIGLLEEGKPARRRLKDTLNTIKTTLEMAAAGNALASAVLERIHQILKLIG